MFAELLAILRGRQLIWDLGYQSIILKSDSLAALNLIDDDQLNDFHPHMTILSLIKTLSYLPWMVSFSHTSKEDNETVDWLVKCKTDNTNTLKI